LRPFPRYAYKDLNSALPHSSVCCTPAPPNLDTWVSLPPPLASSPCLLSSQISPARPDPRLLGQIQDSESVGSTIYNRDPSPPGRSESASLLRVVWRDSSLQGQIRVHVCSSYRPLYPPVRSSQTWGFPSQFINQPRGYGHTTRAGYHSRAGLEPGTSILSTLHVDHYAARKILGFRV
jgi:hypothetical protein